MKSFAAATGIPYEKGRQGFLTDLDTLYDTRLAVIEEVSTDLALHHVQAGWATRLYDKAEPIPAEKFAELYAARDLDTLVLANPTMAVEAIRGWATQVHNAMLGTPYRGFIEIFVNVWPYRLSRTQAVEMGEKLSKTLDDTVRVTMINLDPMSITAFDAKLYFSCIMMQDWQPWLEERAQKGELKRAPLPDVTLYAPKILRGSISPGEMEQIRDKDLFSTIEDRMKPIIGLEFVETEFFSTVITPELAASLRAKRNESGATA